MGYILEGELANWSKQEGLVEEYVGRCILLVQEN
jgi:hypothetical protein